MGNGVTPPAATLPGVLCAGRVYCDLVFSGLHEMPKPGTEIYAEQLSLHSGGGAAITAHTLATLGRPAELCANLPAEPFSSIIRSEIGSVVGLQYCSTEENADPQITAVLTGNMDRSFVTRRAGDALPGNYRDSIEHLSNRGSITHLHISELATLLEHPDLVSLARVADWTVSLDCAWDAEAMHAGEALGLIETVDIFLPAKVEYDQLARKGLTVDSAPMTIIKNGEAGAHAYGKCGIAEVAASKTSCLDATGAGDAFNAGFIHAWLDNQPLQACLVSGNRSGAMAIQHLGGIARQ